MTEPTPLTDEERPPQWLGRLRWWLLWHGWTMCDTCRRMRPTFYADRRWAVPKGGMAGYYDFCSRRCEGIRRRP